MKTFLILLLSGLSLVAQSGLRSPAFVAQLRPAAAGSYSPSDTANLFAWYKSDALLTNSTGTSPPAADESVKGWGDSSGNGRHVTTNNPTAIMPIFKSAAAIGKSQGGLEFGSGKRLRVGFTALPDTTIFVVWRAAISGGYVFATDSTNSSARQGVYQTGSGVLKIYSGTEQTASSVVPNPSWNILCGVFTSSGNDSSYTNGVVFSTTLTSGNQSLDGLTLGSDWSGSSPLSVGEYLGEVIVYDRNLTGTEIGQVSTYLNSRWSVY